MESIQFSQVIFMDWSFYLFTISVFQKLNELGNFNVTFRKLWRQKGIYHFFLTIPDWEYAFWVCGGLTWVNMTWTSTYTAKVPLVLCLRCFYFFIIIFLENIIVLCQLTFNSTLSPRLYSFLPGLSGGCIACLVFRRKRWKPAVLE